MAKINISIDDELLEKLDKYADASYMSRSAFITQCVNDKIIQQESLRTLMMISSTLEEISNKTDLNEDVKSEVDTLVNASNMLLMGLKSTK